MNRTIPSVGRAVIDAEGARIAGAFATPQGNWLATSDSRLVGIFRRLNDRAWSQRWKGTVDSITPLPVRGPSPSAADAKRCTCARGERETCGLSSCDMCHRCKKDWR